MNSPFDSVDEKLLKVDGKIFRGRDPLLCTHGMHGMCDYCEPLDPFDSHLYLMTENKLNTAKTEENTTINTVSKLPTFKHMSFHAWLRQLSIEKSGSLQNYLSGNPLIEEPRYTVDLTCKNHAPYPKAICSACQVPPITLRVQPYRMVDHVEFEDASGFLVDDFVKGWRQSGYQVYGILFGYYDGISTEESPDGNISKSTTSISSPPLGIKAVVQGIFEPLQEGSLDGFELLMDSDIGTSLGRLFEKSLHYFGLKVLGHIYTDLRPKERDQLADMGATSSTNASRDGVAFLRNKNSFFVSGFECQFMAEQQSKLPFSPCPWASKAITPSKGYSLKGAPSNHRVNGSMENAYDSRFVSVIITGDSQHQVALSAFQLSRIGTQLFSNQFILPCSDPRLLFLNKKTVNFDVLYREGSQRVIQVKDTFPVDYLLVNLTAGFRIKDEEKSDLAKKVPLFAARNFNISRQFFLANANPNSPSFLKYLALYLKPLLTADSKLSIENYLSDFGFFMALVALHLAGTFFSHEELATLASLIIVKASTNDFISFIEASPSFQSLLTLLPDPDTAHTSSLSSSGVSHWICQICTFNNIIASGERVCEMCGIPQ